VDGIFVETSTKIFVSTCHTYTTEERMDLSAGIIEYVFDIITEKYRGSFSLLRVLSYSVSEIYFL
jgi:hypothetical protein